MKLSASRSVRCAWISVAALAVAATSMTASGCGSKPSAIQFLVAGKLGDRAVCEETGVSNLSPAVSSLRLSVRFRDASGAVVLDHAGNPMICDSLITDLSKGSIVALTPPAGARADIFVEGWSGDGQRIASGAELGLDVGPASAALLSLPSVRLLPTENFSCVTNTDPAPQIGVTGGGVRLGQHRAFHTATLLPNGQVLFLGGITTSGKPGDDTGASDTMEQYFVTGTPEVYDPSTRRMLPVADTNSATSARAFHNAAYLGTTTDGKYEILVVGGVGQKVPGMPTFLAHSKQLTARAPSNFRYVLDPSNAVPAASEIVIYDPNPSKPSAPSLTHAAAPSGLDKGGAMLQAGTPLSPTGLAVAGGIGTVLALPPVSTVAVAHDDKTPVISGALGQARSGAGMVAIPDSAGTSVSALVIGGIGDPNGATVSPFEQVDLHRGTSTSATATGIDFPNYLFPTVINIDPPTADTTRLLVAGGLGVTDLKLALDPPSVAMEVISYGTKAGGPLLTVPISAGSPGGAAMPWMIEASSVCSKGAPGIYRPVAWNAATLLVSPDQVLNGDRVLSTGGTPRNNIICNECDAADPSLSCALKQTATVPVNPPNGGPIALYQASPLQLARFGHTQTVLLDHTVLIAGGLAHKPDTGTTTGAAQIEIYNPARTLPVAGSTGDLDDPLKAELAAAHLTRKPAALAFGASGPAAIQCVVPKK